MTQTEPTWQKTACILCECNCGIEVQVEDRRLARIRGDKSHPSSEGYTCEKPLRLDRYQNGTERLTSPLRRRADGSYEEIDWDTAITEIAGRLRQVQDEHGGDKIFFYGGGGQGNHLGAGYGQSLQAAVGAKYRSNALAQEKTGEMFVDGRLYGGHTKGDFERAEVVVFVGKNPWQSHSFPRARPVLKEMAADPDRCMVVIDPRRSETAAMADIHLQVKPGTDAWCLAALGAVLVQEDLVDHAFIADHTTGAEPVLAAYAEVDVADYADALRRTRGPDPYDGAPDRRRRERVHLRGPRHPAGPAQHAELLPQQDAVDPHRQLRQAGRDVPALVVRRDRRRSGGPRGGRRRSRSLAAAARRFPRDRRRPPDPRVPARRDRRAPLARADARPGGEGRDRQRQARPRRAGASYAGHRSADHLRPGALQLDRRGDPHRPPRPVPGDVDRQRQPGALAADSAASARPCGRSTSPSSSTSR